MVWIIATSSRTGCVTPITKQNERKKIVSTSTAPHCRRGAPRQLHAVASALLASPCFPVTTPGVLRSPEPTPRPAPLLVLCAACTLPPPHTATAPHPHRVHVAPCLRRHLVVLCLHQARSAAAGRLGPARPRPWRGYLRRKRRRGKEGEERKRKESELGGGQGEGG